MWQANKGCILFLLAGFVLLGGAYFWLLPDDELLARRVLSTGICILLATAGLISWLLARKGR